MSWVEDLQRVSAVQASGVVGALQRCLEKLDAAAALGSAPAGTSTNGANSSADETAWMRACCSLLQHGAVLAHSSDFLNQELVKRLHGALEARPCLAAAVLDRHLPLLLQLPGALRLLLWALPAAHSSQALVYRRLCACFDAGPSVTDGEDGEALRQALHVAKSCAAWELQKLVPLPAQPAGATPEGTVQLVEHLPWLLHLQLLCGCPEPDHAAGQVGQGELPQCSASSASGAGSDARSASTHQQAPSRLSASPGAAAGAAAAAQGSGAQPAGGVPVRDTRRDSTGMSVLSTTDSPSEGLAAGGRGTSEAASLQLPGAQAGAGTAAAAVLLRHLCNGDALCAMLGVTMQSAERLHPADPQEVHAAERPTGDAVLDAILGALGSGGAEQPAESEPGLTGLPTRARIATQLVEVLLEALLRPGPVAGELLGTVRSAESLQAEAGRASGEGGAACCSDDEKAAALELATLHMHLRALADRPGHPVTEGGGRPCQLQHLRPASLTALIGLAEAALKQQRATGSYLDHMARSGGRGSSVSPGAAAHLLKLLGTCGGPSSNTCGSGSLGSRACTPVNVPQQHLLAPDQAARVAMAFYDISLAGPQHCGQYGSAAAMAVAQALGGQRMPAYPDGDRIGSGGALCSMSQPASTAKRTREDAAMEGEPISGSSRQAGGAAGLHQPKMQRMAPEAGSAEQAAGGIPPEKDEWATESEDDLPQNSAEEEDVEECPLLSPGMAGDAAAEEWWEHYIAVKLDLVQTVLQDSVLPDQDEGGGMSAQGRPTLPSGAAPEAASFLDTPSARAGTAAWQASASAAAKHRLAIMGFRQPEWQSLHVASLQLLSDALSAGRAVLAKPGSSAKEARSQAEWGPADGSASFAVLEVLKSTVPDQDAQAAVRNACLLINPSCSNHDYNVAIAGAKADRAGALLVWMGVRMGRYLSGPGDEPVPALVPQYLAALEDLSDSLYAHSSASAGAQGPEATGGRQRRAVVTPRELLSRVLLALLDAGDLALGDCSAGEGGTRCLVRLALRGFPDAATRQALAASALVGLSQGQLGRSRKRPRWRCAHDTRHSWHAVWHDAAESAPFAVCAAAASQLLAALAERGAAAKQPLSPAAFPVVADAVLLTCQAVECWEGLEAEGLGPAMEELLRLCVELQARCATAAAELLRMLSSPGAGPPEGGEADGARVRALCVAAAYGVEAAPALLRFCQRLAQSRPRLHPDQVAELQRQVALGCQPGTAMLLERLAAPPCQQGEPGAQQPKGAQDRVPAGAFGEPGGSPARTAAQLGHTDGVAGPLPQGIILQARVSEWLGEAYEALKASGVASSGRPQPGAPHADEGDSDAESSLDGSAASDGNPSGPISRGWSSEQQVSKQGAKRRWKSRNPFVRAALAEVAAHGGGGVPSSRARQARGGGEGDSGAEDDDLDDDLDDFVVCQPGRDYGALFAQQFKYSCREAPPFARAPARAKGRAGAPFREGSAANPGADGAC